MIRPLRAAASAVVLLLGVAGCHPVAVLLAAGGTVAAAADSYCAAVTEQGRQALRDLLSDGRPLLSCPVEDR